MTTAQQIADLFQTDRKAAMELAKTGRTSSRWFGGCDITFADGSIVTMRFGMVESPRPSPIVWTPAKRIEYDV